MHKRLSFIVPVVLMGIVIAAHTLSEPAVAEYGDVVLNEYSDEAGMRPVVFPHWFHRVRFRCKVCHGDLGFAFKAGGNQINMVKIIDGQYCGACHDGGIAWSVENCDLCHSGNPDTPTQVHHSTVQQLMSAARKNAESDDDKTSEDKTDGEGGEE